MRKKLFVMFLMFSVLTAVVLYAGGKKEEPRAETKEVAAPALKPGEYNEAPMLAELVKQGKLEPLENRLPKDPIVVKPYESIGQYGGTWRMWWDKPQRDWLLVNLFKYERMVRQKADMSYEMEPDLADWWKVSDDKKEYTFHIREGLKWSDGHPFTTEDIEFFWNDVMHNETLQAVLMPHAAHKAGRVVVLDSLTFKVVFDEPNGVFLVKDSLHGLGERNRWHEFPMHYLKQFHSKYASEQDLAAKMKKANAASWDVLFNSKANYMINPDLPQVSMFVFTGTVEGGQREIWERNPYYYKVDTAGNQLPYIDRMTIDLVLNVDIASMRTIVGDFDYHIGSFRANHYPILKQNEAKGPYIVDGNRNAKAGEFSLFFNQTTEDPVLRKIFQDIRFRQAVSLALNRQEIINNVFWGAAEARQFSPVKGDPLYDPEWERSFVEYDPDRANRLLDEMGLTKRDKDGFRLRPDGKTFQIIFDYSTDKGWQDAYQLVSEYLIDVGIKIIQRGSERNVITSLAETNKTQMTSWSINACITDPSQYIPLTPWISQWGYKWALWLETDGEKGEKPPEDILKISELLEKAQVASSPEEEIRLLKEAGNIHKKNLWIITIMGLDNRPAVVHKRMKNVRMDSIPFNTFIPTPSGSSHPEQFWVDPSVPIK